MKFTIIREKLLESLSRVYGVIEHRQTIPILSNLLLKVENNILSITGTDMEIELVTIVKSLDSETGEITISARKFLEICRALPAQKEIYFFKEKGRAVIKSGKSRFVLGTLSSTDYPNSNPLIKDVKIKEREYNIKRLIELTQFAMGYQDVRYWLNGLLLEISEKKIRAVATDGHRLALADLKVDVGFYENVFQIIVPRKGVNELSRMLSNEDKEIELCIGNNSLQIDFVDTRFTSKLIDGKYPDYKGVLPNLSNLDKEVFIEKDLLRQALARASILCTEGYRSVQISFDRNMLKINTRNMEQERAEDQIDINYEGKPLDIRFNITYLLDVISAISTKELCMYLKDSDDSCLIKPVGKDDCQYVVMPMKL